MSDGQGTGDRDFGNKSTAGFKGVGAYGYNKKDEVKKSVATQQQPQSIYGTVPYPTAPSTNYGVPDTATTYGGIDTQDKVINMFNQFDFEKPIDPEYEARVNETLKVLGAGENQVRMLAENGITSQKTADRLTQLFAQTAASGGINLLGAAAAMASNEADYNTRQANVAKTELGLIQNHQNQLAKWSALRNQNALAKAKLIADSVNTKMNTMLAYDKLNAGILDSNYNISSANWRGTIPSGSSGGGSKNGYGITIQQQNIPNGKTQAKEDAEKGKGIGGSVPDSKTQAEEDAKQK